MSARPNVATPKNAAGAPVDRVAAGALPPMKPHRGWFVGLSVALVLWVGVLIAMFFSTVYPLRHSIASTHPAIP